VWKSRKKSFMPWMKAFLFVGRRRKVLHNADEGHFACGKAGKRPSYPR